jgi:hypothetical protein
MSPLNVDQFGTSSGLMLREVAKLRQAFGVGRRRRGIARMVMVRNL